MSSVSDANRGQRRQRRRPRGPRSSESFANVGDVDLCYQTFGADGQPPLLLIMGLGAQMILWEDDFCEALAAEGFQVIRFDNRDIGHSTRFGDSPVPTRSQLLRRDRRAAVYSLEDMADDTAGLLDHLAPGAAHIVGASMGGMIAQLLAIRHPHRVLSMVSIMSTTGSRRVGWTHPRLYPRLIRRVRTDRDGYIADFVAGHRAIGSRIYPPEVIRSRALAERCFERGFHPAGAARHLAAIATARDRTPWLRQLRVPTTVIHGDADLLVVPSGGRATAAAIPDSRLVMVPGMAHDLPRALWPQLIEPIVENLGRARGSAFSARRGARLRPAVSGARARGREAPRRD